MRDLVARSNCCDYFSYFGFTVKYFMLQLFQRCRGNPYLTIFTPTFVTVGNFV